MADPRRMQQPPLITLVTVIFLLDLGDNQLASYSSLHPSKDTQTLLEFKKGIREDPLGLVLGSWNQTSLEKEGRSCARASTLTKPRFEERGERRQRKDA